MVGYWDCQPCVELLSEMILPPGLNSLKKL